MAAVNVKMVLLHVLVAFVLLNISVTTTADDTGPPKKNDCEYCLNLKDKEAHIKHIQEICGCFSGKNSSICPVFASVSNNTDAYNNVVDFCKQFMKPIEESFDKCSISLPGDAITVKSDKYTAVSTKPDIDNLNDSTTVSTNPGSHYSTDSSTVSIKPGPHNSTDIKTGATKPDIDNLNDSTTVSTNPGSHYSTDSSTVSIKPGPHYSTDIKTGVTKPDIDNLNDSTTVSTNPGSHYSTDSSTVSIKPGPHYSTDIKTGATKPDIDHLNDSTTVSTNPGSDYSTDYTTVSTKPVSHKSSSKITTKVMELETTTIKIKASAAAGYHNPGGKDKSYSLAAILWSIFLSFGAGILIAVIAKMFYNRYRKDSYVLPPEQGAH